MGVIVALACFAVRGPTEKLSLGRTIHVEPGGVRYSPPSNIFVSKPSLERKGGGGENNPVPATHGFLPVESSIQLAAPRLPDDLRHELPVPVTILEEQAPPILKPVSELGLPWMPKETNSAGPGKDHGIGAGNKGGIGDDDGSGAGEGGKGPYAIGIAMPTCNVCPLPIYTDEARHVKMQGTVTLRVLVGADGKASEIRVVKGVGYGLEDRAVETVRGWKFSPARDAARRAVPAWVIIEAVFRLF